MTTAQRKPIVLHIGDPVKYNPELYKEFSQQFEIVRPSLQERQRPEFIQALKERRWGDFSGKLLQSLAFPPALMLIESRLAIFRPFWNTGGEMGRWDKELIPLLPDSVKIFASAGAGFDWADTDILAEHGIVYCNGASASSEAVADMCIFHILSVFRNLMWSQLAARSLDPDQWLDAHRNSPETAHNPRGKILGIIGLGNIGYTIAKKVYAAFGMKIYYHDLYRKSAEQEEAVQATFCPTLDELLGQADCVAVATPFSGSKLLDADRFQKFKKGSRLVNIARGTLVDEDALVAALKSGHIFAAGLDVHANEPHVHPELAKMRNVTLTCHTAGGAIETPIGFERLAMENIQRVLTGQEPLTPVNKHLLKK